MFTNISMIQMLLILDHGRCSDIQKNQQTGKTRTVRAFVQAVQDLVRGKRGDEAADASCVLAAPTGCASFQMKYGAATVHRVFGVPVGKFRVWKDRKNPRFVKIQKRLQRSRIFVFDEMSMIGRQMLGKIEFKVRDVLGNQPQSDGSEVFFGGKGVVLAGDPKQATPVCDEPLYKEGSYKLSLIHI